MATELLPTMPQIDHVILRVNDARASAEFYARSGSSSKVTSGDSWFPPLEICNQRGLRLRMLPAASVQKIVVASIASIRGEADCISAVGPPAHVVSAHRKMPFTDQ